MADTKKQDVAKTEPEQRTVSQRVRDAATLMESPAERARALQVVSKNMQWSGQLTAPETINLGVVAQATASAQANNIRRAQRAGQI